MILVSTRYKELVSKGKVRFDPAQLAVTEHFDHLLKKISEQNTSRSWSWIFWSFLKRIFKRKRQNFTRITKQEDESSSFQGLYIYGEVGRGKTMLMDLFFSCLPESNKKRAHFNDFMADVHERINFYRQASGHAKFKQDNPILAVAEDLSREAKVLCFDEFSVTDIADAMVLGRLISALFDKEIFFIATSNVAPNNLYYNGLNRELFLPFIQTLKAYVRVVNLDAKTDYRLEKSNLQSVYVTPLGKKADESMDQAWALVLQGHKERSDELSIRGRLIPIPRFAAGCARFDYRDLCAKPLAASEYLVLGEHYHTIFIDNVPIMDDTCRNETKRFILLIDILYERHIRLFMSAAERVEDLYKGHAQTAETFEFQRTQSRLFEMQSYDYLKLWKERFLLKKKL
ncbi:cell division protein ZapE [Bartonella krasnovii]|uniref:AFG1 family ATPase n=1 Tax=Bartonella krasnovii TaxID=2267275 RepID=A0A5B9D3C1_9HYPH|nr:cell division protein ZapE [Bartonella krasnovii]QEE12982.1 AFG1 family ATPase [Bartonella krasnovii]UNF29101.1 cell division protein ZapE [Bartonella krasnovii]UNF35458.1 cell division protein ZapE [Bartonella krasnovii]UNF37072.1 cell division protein ZapE [Bartonella krasnovii]UNF38772.1 cell division protein ZapE [Bartonella krasnovii]